MNTKTIDTDVKGNRSKSPFDKKTLYGDALLEWVQFLDDNRADRAAVRRCINEGEVMMEPAFLKFYFRALMPELKKSPEKELALSGVAAVFGLAAHLRFENNPDESEILGAAEAAKGSRTKSNSSLSLAEQFAKPDGNSGSTPLLSELRFRRLLQRPRDEFYLAMRRVIQHCRGRLSLRDLAESTYFWGGRVQQRWALEYYQAHLGE